MKIISETGFKKLLDLIWCTFIDTQTIINTLEGIGLDVNPSDKNNQPVPFGGLYHMQTVATGALLDIVGVDKDFKSGGNTRSTILEELDQLLFDLITEYPEEDRFPEGGYDVLLEIFISAGVEMELQQEDTRSMSLLSADKNNVRIHKGIVKSNLMPIKGYVWQGADCIYITPHNNGISYDEKEQRITTFALEVYPETVRVSLNISDDNGHELFDGDKVSADGQEITLTLSQPDTLLQFARCRQENKKISLTEYSYRDFLKEKDLL